MAVLYSQIQKPQICTQFTKQNLFILINILILIINKISLDTRQSIKTLMNSLVIGHKITKYFQNTS